IVSLIEDADLALRQILQNVFGIYPPLGLIGGLPAHGPRKVLGVAELGGAGGHKQLRHLFVIEVLLDRVIGWRSQALKNQQHLIALYELARLLHCLCRAEAIVIRNEVDLSSVDAPLSVESLEKGVLRPANQGIGRERAAVRHDVSELDL